jgi:hypothetical protein
MSSKPAARAARMAVSTGTSSPSGKTYRLTKWLDLEPKGDPSRGFGGARLGDPVVQEEPTGAKGVGGGAKVHRQVRSTDVLEHADRCHRVERSKCREVPVVANFGAGEIPEAGGDQPAGRLIGLALGKCHADGFSAHAPGGVPEERAPAAADVEQADPWPQAQLPSDQVELRLLGLVEHAGSRAGGRGGREVGARVGQTTVEPETEEFVADVVVEANRGQIPGPGVSGAGHPGVSSERRRPGRTTPERRAPADQPPELSGTQAPHVERPASVDRRHGIAVDVEVAPQVPLGEGVR